MWASSGRWTPFYIALFCLYVIPYKVFAIILVLQFRGKMKYNLNITPRHESRLTWVCAYLFGKKTQLRLSILFQVRSQSQRASGLGFSLSYNFPVFWTIPPTWCLNWNIRQGPSHMPHELFLDYRVVWFYIRLWWFFGYDGYSRSICASLSHHALWAGHTDVILLRYNHEWTMTSRM